MGEGQVQREDGRRVRVGIVDDIPDMRLLLRFAFEDDERWELVGEAGNGEEAIDLVDEVHPDVLLLDCNMPVLSGVDALPEIRRRSPGTAVVLYTAGATAGTYQAALAGGALDVVEKSAITEDLADRLSRILVDHWAKSDADVEVHIGPVPSAAARVWVDNTAKIIAAVRAHPEVLAAPVSIEVLDLFADLLHHWRDVAAATDDFYWAARANVSDVKHIVAEWAVIDAMTDEQLDRLGVHWSPPEGEPFFAALSAAMLDTLAKHEETHQLAATLGRQWEEYSLARRAGEAGTA